MGLYTLQIAVSKIANMEANNQLTNKKENTMNDHSNTQKMMNRQLQGYLKTKQLAAESQVEIEDDGDDMDVIHKQDSELVNRDRYCFFR